MDHVKAAGKTYDLKAAESGSLAATRVSGGLELSGGRLLGRFLAATRDALRQLASKLRAALGKRWLIILAADFGLEAPCGSCGPFLPRFPKAV